MTFRLTDTSTTTLLKAASYGLLIVFLYRFYDARRKIANLRKANLCMPEFNLAFGHFLALSRVLRRLPPNCQIHEAFSQIARRFPNGLFYVDIWPYAQPLLIVTTPSAALQVQQNGLSKPSEVFAPVNKITGGESLLTMVDSTWKTWRNLFNPGFSAGYVLEMVPLIVQEVAVFRQKLQDRAHVSELFQLEEMTIRLALDVIGTVSMDTRLHYQTGNNELATALRSQIEWTSFGTTLNPLKRYLSARPIVQWYNNNRMNRYIHAEIDKRYSEIMTGNGQASKSVLSLALQSYLHEMQVESSDKVDQAFKDTATANLRLFLFAGHDTTSSTLIYCYHILASHPKALSQIRSEHDQIFGKDRAASRLEQGILDKPQRLNELPYTTAVIKETLRLHPPASSMRSGRSGVDIIDEDGNHYPTEGCYILTLTPAVHRNPRYWKEPEKFCPERWLVGPQDDFHPVEGAWRPFHLGPRNCIGQTLALMELRIALVMTLSDFDVQPAYDEWDKLHPRNSVKEIDGDRVYPTEQGGAIAHPDAGYPCRVTLHK